MTHDQPAVRAVIDEVRAAGRDALTAPEANRICRAYGIPAPREGLARSAAEAVELAREIGFPVVLKIVSPNILHKTDAGGVLAGIENPDGVADAYQKIVAAATAYDPNALVSGVQVQQMVAGGQEVIVGATTDSTFGKVIALGLGGIMVEVLKDVTFRLAPISADEAATMIDDLAGAEILRGARGAEPVSRGALADLVSRVSD
ncbi:MAG: acetate--CoA ligase family protein, partial [Streptosporangiaceae bacterium]